VPVKRNEPRAVINPNEEDGAMTMPPTRTLAAATLLLCGCVTQHPQNAEEFRKMAPGAFMVKVETHEVNRSLREIGATFRARAPECLNMRVTTTSQMPGSYQVIVSAYKPTVVVTDQKAELHVQRHHEKGVLAVTKEPEGGYYLMVADAYPVDAKRSRLQIIGPSIGYDVIYRAIMGWATGKNLGCPDLAKIG
jgi:hypothetical protein